MFNFIYIIKNLPSDICNFVELTNEISVYTILLCSIMFMHSALPFNIQSDLGWFIIYFSLMSILINIMVVVRYIIVNMKRDYFEFMLRRAKKKALNNYIQNITLAT